MGILSRLKKKGKSEKDYAKEFMDSMENGGNVLDGFDLIKAWYTDYPNDANVYYANVIVTAQAMNVDGMIDVLSTKNGDPISLQTLYEIFESGERCKSGWEEGTNFLKQQAQLQIIARRLQDEEEG